jgi:hypothetical protein
MLKVSQIEHYYEVPKFERHYYWFYLAIVIFIASVWLLSTQYSTLNKNGAPIPSLRTTAGYVGIGVWIFAIYSLIYWLGIAPFLVHRVLWDEDKLILGLQRGGQLSVPWPDLAGVEIPACDGPTTATTVHRLRAKIKIAGRYQRYEIPLSFTTSCKELIQALQQHAPA